MPLINNLKNYLVIKMYREIENILVRTLSPYEYEKMLEIFQVARDGIQKIIEMY